MKLPKVPVRHAVLAMAPYGAPNEGRAKKLRLDFNENTVGCSPAVLRAISGMTVEQMAIYPEYQATTKRLARFFQVRPEEIPLTNGIDDALHLIADTFIDAGDMVLIAEPTFDMYRFFSELAGARTHTPLHEARTHFRVASALADPLHPASPNAPLPLLPPPESHHAHPPRPTAF